MFFPEAGRRRCVASGLWRGTPRAGYGELPERAAREQEATGQGRVFNGAYGAAGSPYAIVVPADQSDPATVTKLLATLAAAPISAAAKAGLTELARMATNRSA